MRLLEFASVNLFFEEFLEWISSLTWGDFVLIFLPLILLDFARCVVKVAVILAHLGYTRIKRKKLTEHLTLLF